MEEHVIQADINLSALRHNVSLLKGHVGSDVLMAAVVKANAYGHGAVEVARAALEEGADRLAVARFSEAMELRTAGIGAPILMFGQSPAEHARQMIDLDLTPTMNSYEDARRLSEEAVSLGKRISVHVKIDTGMGRVGLVDRRVDDYEKIIRLPGIEVTGIFTHFANADAADKTHALEQFRLFQQLLDQLERRALPIPLRHAANSAATIEMPRTHLDMVRPGIALYGLPPSNEVDSSILPLKPVMTLKARIIQVKEVPSGFKVSYGSTHETREPGVIASVPVGYADGYSRLLSSKGSMLVKGQRAPVIGRVCMDLTMIDVSHIQDVRPGDEVVILGSQGSEVLSADEIAGQTGTINYEVVSSIASRVPRVTIA